MVAYFLHVQNLTNKVISYWRIIEYMLPIQYKHFVNKLEAY